jgi:hypothetical protein
MDQATEHLPGKHEVFSSIPTMVTWPVALGLWQHSTSLWKHMVKETCSPHGGQEAKRKIGSN